LLILSIISVYISICVPGAGTGWLLAAGAFALAAAILTALWLIFCDQPCLWGLLFAWEVGLGAGIGALYFARCCPILWAVGAGLILSSIGLMLGWAKRCGQSRCDVLRELLVVFIGVIIPVLGYIFNIPVLQACLSAWLAATVSAIGGLIGIAYASCSRP
jgi:hypothetical protein